MNTINTIYTIGLVCILLMMGAEFTFWMFILSAFLATIPFTTHIFFAVAPILVLLWCFFFGGDPYDSDFAWLALAYVPFFYTSALSLIVDGIKGIFGSN